MDNTQKEINVMKVINKNQKGFSLVELMVVMAILVVVAGVLIPSYMKHIDSANKESTLANCCNIVNATEI